MTVATPLGGVGLLEANDPAPLLGAKVCLGCGQVKELSLFHRMARLPDGYRPRCKECRKESSRAYYEQNAEVLVEKSRKFRNEYPEVERERKRDYRARNLVRIRAKDRRYYLDHRDEILAYNKTPARRAAHRANAKYQKAKRKAAITATVQPITAEQWEELQRSYLLLCVYCLERCADLTMDHVVPLNRGGDHMAGNIVPACRSCNRSKSDTPLLAFFVHRPITA